jgi:hypothetical protein
MSKMAKQQDSVKTKIDPDDVLRAMLNTPPKKKKLKKKPKK